MRKTIYIFLIVVLGISCGTKKQLHQSFSGKPVSSLTPVFGKPVSIIESAGDSVYIFEKTEELRSTEINQGRLSLDPMVSPKVKKTERFYFTVNNGLIIRTRLEEQYDR